MSYDLRQQIDALVEDDLLTWTELSLATKYSKTTLSLWRHRKYSGDTRGIETAIVKYLDQKDAAQEHADLRLSFPDSIRLTSILQLLDESDNAQAICAVLGKCR